MAAALDPLRAEAAAATAAVAAASPGAASSTQRLVGVEPPCSCRRLRAGVRVRCERFERWAQRCDVRAAAGIDGARYAALLEMAQQGPPYLDESTSRQVNLDVERSCPALSFFQGGGGRRMLTNILCAWVVLDKGAGGGDGDAAAAAAEGATQKETAAEDSGGDAAGAATAAAGTEAAESGDARSPGGGPTAAAMDGAADAAAVVPVGYVQGMSFIAMNLLWHAGKEEAAFWVFVAMMQRYDLRTMFEPPDMKGLQMRTSTVTHLIQYTRPELSRHLAEYLQNSLGLIVTDWLLTLFACSMALGPLAELWDRFFSAGYSVIYRLILARLRCLEPWLLREKDFTRLAHLVRFAHVNFDRVEGLLVPRLRMLAPKPQPSLLKRIAVGAVSLVSRESDMSGPEDIAPVAFAQQNAAAWTCSECNGSENCESWLSLVTELAEAECIAPEVIERFERIFGTCPQAGEEGNPVAENFFCLPAQRHWNDGNTEDHSFPGGATGYCQPKKALNRPDVASGWTEAMELRPLDPRAQSQHRVVSRENMDAELYRAAASPVAEAVKCLECERLRSTIAELRGENAELLRENAQLRDNVQLLRERFLYKTCRNL